MQLASCQAYWEMYCACSNYKELVNKVPTVLKAAMMASLRIMSTLLTSSLYLLQAMHLAVSLAAAARVAMYVKAAPAQNGSLRVTSVFSIILLSLICQPK